MTEHVFPEEIRSAESTLEFVEQRAARRVEEATFRGFRGRRRRDAREWKAT